MKKILHITSSPRGEASHSTLLGNTIVRQLQNLHPGAALTVADTVAQDYSHMTPLHLEAYHTPSESRSAAHLDANRDSDEAVQQLMDADAVVISVPIHNFSIPSALKAWIDHVVRMGQTFSYGTGKPEGLLKNKKAYLAVSSGGVYSEGPLQPFDYAVPYLNYILGFIGITDVSVYRVEGAAYQEDALSKGLEQVAIA